MGRYQDSSQVHVSYCLMSYRHSSHQQYHISAVVHRSSLNRHDDVRSIPVVRLHRRRRDASHSVRHARRVVGTAGRWLENVGGRHRSYTRLGRRWRPLSSIFVSAVQRQQRDVTSGRDGGLHQSFPEDNVGGGKTRAAAAAAAAAVTTTCSTSRTIA